MDLNFIKRHPHEVSDMAILEEFFKKNNFDEPQTLIESMRSKYQIKKDYLFLFVKKMSVLKGAIKKNFFKPEDIEVYTSESEEEDFSESEEMDRIKERKNKRKNRKRKGKNVYKSQIPTPNGTASKTFQKTNEEILI